MILLPWGKWLRCCKKKKEKRIMNNFCFLNLFTYITYNSSFSVMLCICLFLLPRCVLLSALFRDFFNGISRVALFMGCTKSHQNLMNSINYVNIKLTKLIMTCLDLRNNLLSNHHDVT